jgi:hypothetical protein
MVRVNFEGNEQKPRTLISFEGPSAVCLWHTAGGRVFLRNTRPLGVFRRNTPGGPIIFTRAPKEIQTPKEAPHGRKRGPCEGFDVRRARPAKAQTCRCVARCLCNDIGLSRGMGRGVPASKRNRNVLNTITSPISWYK